MSEKKYVIGLDYGSDSARSIIVDVETGKEMATAVKYYPRWMDGKYCVPHKDQYRQHPLDYIEVLEYTVKEALAQCPPDVAENVVGMAFDTTGSTPVLTNAEGTPLALTPEFAENPNAMFVLWKDHTAVKEAAQINELAAKWEVDYTQYEGGVYSSEWVWAKILHVLRDDEVVRNASYSWIEHCDWLPALITGNTKPEEIKRSRCAAGHKAMWHEEWGGLPSEKFLTTLDPLLAGYRDRLFEKTYTSDEVVGTLTEEWAKRLGLSTKVKVGVGAFDAHMGAVGGEVTPKTLVRIMGTSTCDIMVADYDEVDKKLIPGICGQVDGSVIPMTVGLEAGQSAFGDVYAWFKRLITWPLSFLDDKELAAQLEDKIIPKLSEEASKMEIGETALLATDWMNGRRTPDANQLVKGTITGINLGSTAPMIFRALVEATAFGSKAIVDRFVENGVEIDQIIALGGVAKKSKFVMQTLADVLNMPIKVHSSDQTCAFGAAMFAAVNAGEFKTVTEAQKVLGQGFETSYTPNEENHKKYLPIYENYLKLGAWTEKELFNK
ncbi:ribulokinase [Saccharicrinis sp. FJH62]|uniref:ribulokinase n=1 Tax=Saccharicrinis sp. FJH62 TaxID=3344657 RepID=UPI0035D3F206